MNEQLDKRLADLTGELANAYIRKNQAEETIKRIEAAYTEVTRIKEEVGRPKPPPFNPELDDSPTVQGD